MKLEKKHYEAIELELEGCSISEICRRVGINSRQTYYNWKKDKDYISALDKAREDFQKSTNNYIKSKATNYINKIEELISNPKTSEKTKSDLLKYMVNRALGVPTSKQEIHNIEEVKVDEEFDMSQFLKDVKESNKGREI
ncbi:MAG: phBC6A51 family helix-turn-helix protein [Clostridium sp.]|uniref:phBC6A51 family helix-turn-helix protein n=1 Tax=Clostridium sp. TaxID=1506 RepID=UPI003F35E2FA